MIRIDQILLPTDLSPASRRAMSYALFLAEQCEAAVHLYHAVVLHADDPAAAEQLVPLRQRLEEAMLDVSRSRLAEWIPEERRGRLEVEEVRERGFSAPAMILEYAEREDVDLVVMGTHGRRGPGRLLLGSVAEGVVRHAGCPVLVVPAVEEPRALEAFDRILVPVDLSEHSKLAVAHGKELAALYDASLEIVHVIHVTTYPVFYGPAQALRTEGVKERCLEAIDDLVDTAPGPEVGYDKHVLQGRPAAAIVEFARQKEIDLLVIPTHGMSGLERSLMGSVTERVVRQAECPVLTVPSFGKSLLG